MKLETRLAMNIYYLTILTFKHPDNVQIQIKGPIFILIASTPNFNYGPNRIKKKSILKEASLWNCKTLVEIKALNVSLAQCIIPT